MNHFDNPPNGDAQFSDQSFDRSNTTGPNIPDIDALIEDTFDEPGAAWLLGQSAPPVGQSNETDPIESPQDSLQKAAFDEVPIDPGIDSDVFGPNDAWSPSIDRMVRRVSQLIRLDLPGSCFWGVQRVGKSRAVNYMLSQLPILFGGALACARMSMADLTPTEMRNFLHTFMSHVGCRSYHRDTAIARVRLIDYLAERAERCGTTRMFIVIDEAQRLLPEHYKTLITIFNELEIARLRPFVLLFGQPEMKDIYEGFSNPRSLQEIGRFFNLVEEFLPIRGDEVESVLEAMDSETSDGQAFGPRYLLPALYAAGFELKQLAPAIQEALQTLSTKFKHRIRISMQHLRTLVIYLLQYLYHRRAAPTEITAEVVISGFQDFGFVSVMLAYAEN